MNKYINRYMIKGLLATFWYCSTSVFSAFAIEDLTDSNPNNISVSGENTPNEGKTEAFDNNVNSKWLTFSSSGWISYNFAQPVTISKYTVTSGNDASTRDPKNWELEGSNDGINWSYLDARNEQYFSQRKQTKNYSVSTTQPFSKIRFNVLTNNGANILQLSELEFIGTGIQSAQLPLSDNETLAQGSWQHYGQFNADSAIVANTTGTGDADLYMRAGEQPTLNQYDCVSYTPSSTENCSLSDNNIYVSVYAYSATTYQIDITEESVNSGEWTAPQVSFVDMNPETEGSQLLNRIFSDPAGHMAQRCIDVAKMLYKDSAESSRFHHLRFELRAKNSQGNEFVAYKTGQDGSGEMTIAVSTTHLAKLYRDGGNSDSAIRDEIDGILFHEVTHGYNNSPLTTDSYGDGGPYWAYTEGIADGVRIAAGFHKTRSPDVNGSRKWLGGYTTTGFFLQYVNEKIDPEFLYKFNKAAKYIGDYNWSFESAFQATINRSVDDVWQEYKNFINNGGVLNY
ncbi:MAG: discoidin domain-containing protein [Colwellia sp.]|nr:discoidin domain-containing protein [Colwellia sp.]